MITLEKILENPSAPFELCDAFVRTMEILAPSKALVLYLDERMGRALCAVIVTGEDDCLVFSDVHTLTYHSASSPTILCQSADRAIVKYETEEGVVKEIHLLVLNGITIIG